MALSANTVWEVRTTGSDTNGGGFVTGSGGTDFSQQDAAQIAVADAVANGTTTITSATAGFLATHVGNLIYLAGGTGSLAAGWYQVVTRTNGTTITVDRTVATGTGITLNLGGALASAGLAALQKVAGNDVWIKSGTYTLTTSTAGAGGVINDTTGGQSASNVCRWEGYGTTRGDKGTRPVISAGLITAITLFTVGAGQTLIDNIILDGNSKATTTGLACAQVRCGFIRVKVQNTTVNGYNISGGNDTLYRCEATGCSGTAAFNLSTNVEAVRCEAYANTTVGFTTGGQNVFVGCIASGNTGASSDGFQAVGLNATLLHCVSYGNGRHGYNIGGNGYQLVEGCIAENNSGWGFTQTIGNSGIQEFFNCAARNNTSGAFDSANLTGANIGFINGTTGFFVDGANGNFALNSTAGGGALLRGTGFGTMPRGTTVSYFDVGAAQHRDSGGTAASLKGTVL
jgi:hypothetical protein